MLTIKYELRVFVAVEMIMMKWSFRKSFHQFVEFGPLHKFKMWQYFF